MKSFPSAVTLQYCNLQNSASDWSEPLATRFCRTERNCSNSKRNFEKRKYGLQKPWELLKPGIWFLMKFKKIFYDKKLVICHPQCHNLEMQKLLVILVIIELYAWIDTFKNQTIISTIKGPVFYLGTLPLKIFFQNCEIPSCFLENMSIDKWESKGFLFVWSINTFTRDLFQCLVMIFICRTDVSKNCHSLLWKSS